MLNMPHYMLSTEHMPARQSMGPKRETASASGKSVQPGITFQWKIFGQMGMLFRCDASH